MKEEQIWILISKKITGEISPTELADLQQILAENTEWQTSLDRLQEIWASKPPQEELYSSQNQDFYLSHINRLKNTVSDFYEVGELEELDFAKEEKTSFFSNWKVYAVAASLIVVLVASYISISNSNKVATQAHLNEVNVSKGSKSKIVLPDGSQVWINAGSKLTYSEHFKKEFREVTLDGEAYFDVAKDKAHPFIVHTSGIDIKVLGTAFNVKAYKVEPTIEATLIHGSIEVVNINQPNAPKLLMKPHEKMVFNKAGVKAREKAKIASIETVNTINNTSISITPLPKKFADTAIVETAWVYNKLAFDDERFEDVAIKMERWYNVSINVNDDKLKNQIISGSFINESVDDALKVLQLIVPFRYKNVNGEIIINKK